MPDLDAALEFAIKLAKESGEIAVNHYNPDIAFNPKDGNSPVTLADIEINKLVIKRCKKKYPDVGVLGEEESAAGQSQWLWVCDPIDGTIPYMMGMKASTFCLALVKDGQPVLGVVYDFFNNRLYSALKGKGAKVNGVAIVKPNMQPLKLISVETYPSSLAVGDLREKLIDMNWQAPNFASASFTAMSVATGRISGIIYTGRYAWDIAAAKVIAEECGCTVVNLDGQQQEYNGNIMGGVIAHQDHAQEIVRWVAESRK